MSLEFAIGVKWTAWIGALVVVFAAAVFAKLAYDKGWFGLLTPAARCLTLAAFSLALLGAGEWALRRVGRAASVGLFSAGLGVGYLTALASYHTFHLLSQPGAFLLLMLVAAVGFAITFRTRFLTIGVLSVVGGYLAPLLLRGAAPFAGAQAIYLTMLLGVALSLSCAMPKPFRALRYVAMAGHAIVGLVAVKVGAMPTSLALVFITLWWAMVQAEAIIAALRGQSSIGNPVAGVLATAWHVIVGCSLMRVAGPSSFNWAGAFTFATALAAAALAATFGPGLDGLRQRPRSAMDRLAVALWCCAGILLATAVALHFDDYGQAVGWLAIGLGSIEAGRHIRSRALDWFGLVVGGLGVATVFIGWSFGWLATPLWRVSGTPALPGSFVITGWAILALVTIAVVHAAARRLRTEGSGGWTAAAVGLAVFGTFLWALVCAMQCRGLAETAAWLLGAVALLGAQRFGRKLRYFEIGVLLLVATAGRWLIADAAMPRLRPGWDAAATLPVLNGQMALAALIAAAGWWVARIAARRAAARETPPAAGPASGIALGITILLMLLLLVGLSFEVDRMVVTAAGRNGALAFGWSVSQARQLLLTMLWIMGAIAMHVVGLVAWPRGASATSLSASLVTRFAVFLLSACAGKWIAIDTLAFAFWRPVERVTHLPLANLQMLVGVALAAAGVIMFVTGAIGAARRASAARGWEEDEDHWATLAGWLPVVGAAMLLWGLSFELERAIALWEDARPADWIRIWPALQLRELWLTALWAAGGGAMALFGAARLKPAMLAAGWAILIGAGLAWLSLDTIAWRVPYGRALASPFLNLQFGVGAGCAILLAIARRATESRRDLLPHASPAKRSLPLAVAIIAAIGLWAGSLEIERILHGDVERHTAISVWWALYGIMLVTMGFLRRAAVSRYAGLSLLAVTLLKVFFVDMAGVETVWRVLSLAAVGLLLIVTSIAYVRLAPRLLKAAGEAETESGVANEESFTP